jgi:hypothetical protein
MYFENSKLNYSIDNNKMTVANVKTNVKTNY